MAEKAKKTMAAVSVLTLFLVASCAVTSSNADVGNLRRALLEGNEGIAARYPGDAGIGQDPAVVFVEKFDVDAVEDLKDRWDHLGDPQGIMSLSGDVPEGSGSRHSLLMTHVGGEGTGANPYRRLKPGYEKIHYRFYVKFDSGCGPLHHFFRVGGYNPLTRWPVQRSGHRPPGNERLMVGVGPHYGPGGSWGVYCYWMEMRGSPPRGQTWGNNLMRNHDAPQLVHDQWICVELMVKLNDIGQRNGELALWIDGELVGHLGEGFPKGKWVWDKFHKGEGGRGVRWCEEEDGRVDFAVAEGGEPFEGLRWRDHEELKINFVWPLFYLTRPEEGHESKVRLAHLVIAEEYIGPMGSP